MSTMALEEFLTEFNEQIVDAIETVWAYAYDKKAEEDPTWESDGEYDDNDHVGNALIDIEIALETLRDMFSSRSHVPQGGRHASQVLIGKRAGTITIVRGSAPDLLEGRAAREEAAELLEAAEADPVPPQPAPVHTPFFPDEDDLEPVFVELFEERHAVN